MFDMNQFFQSKYPSIYRSCGRGDISSTVLLPSFLDHFTVCAIQPTAIQYISERGR